MRNIADALDPGGSVETWATENTEMISQQPEQQLNKIQLIAVRILRVLNIPKSKTLILEHYKLILHE